MAERVKERALYNVYQVAEDYVLLPRENPFLQIKDRMVGNRVVEVVDTNGDGVAGDGDTAILFNGSKVENAQFHTALIQKLSRQEFFLDLAKRKLAGRDTVYDIQRIEPDSFEGALVAMAGSAQHYYGGRVEEAKEIAGNVTDNPALAGAIVVGATALSLHPKGRIILEAVGLAGAMGGTGYVLYDRLDGIRNGTPMGEHDLTAGLAIWGGVSTLRGMTVNGFANDTLQGLSGAGRFLFGGGGSAMPDLVGAGAGGGTVFVSGGSILENSLAMENAAGIVAVGGKMPAVISGVPIYNLVATFPSAGGGLKTRHLKLNEGFTKLDDAAWAKSQAKNSMDEIRSALEIAKEEAQASGRMEDVVQIESALEELNQNMRVIEEVYRHAPEAEVRVAIETLLNEVEGRALSLFHASDSNLTRMILEGVRQRMLIVKDLAGRHGIASFKVAGNGGASLPVLDLPGNVSLARPLDELLPRDPGSRNIFLDALRRFLEFRRQGQWGNIKFNIRGGLSEAKFHNGNGQRIYFGQKGGVTHILRIGDKGTQPADISLAERLGAELGLLGLSVFILNDQGAGEITAETAEIADR